MTKKDIKDDDMSKEKDKLEIQVTIEKAAEQFSDFSKEVTRLKDIENRLIQRVMTINAELVTIEHVRILQSCSGEAFQAMNDAAEKLQSERSKISCYLNISTAKASTLWAR